MDNNNFKIKEDQKFDILVDGVRKEAEILQIVEVEDRRFAIYAVPADESSSDIMASEIIVDEDNDDTLIDIKEQEIKDSILNLINEILS